MNTWYDEITGSISKVEKDISDMDNVNVSKNEVSIDGGKVVVKKYGKDNYYINASGFSRMETSSEPLEPEVMLDPHYYKNGNNKLTVDESVRRCMDELKLMYRNQFSFVSRNILVGFSREQTERIYEDVRRKIAAGDGRDSVYKLFGSILKGYREGMYTGVPFDVVFRAYVNGYIK